MRRSSRRFPKRSFRRTGTRMVTEPRRYQAANFFFTTDLRPTGPSTVDVQIVELVTTDHLFLGGTGNQIIMPALSKGIEIGGFVYATNGIVTVSDTGGTNASVKMWFDLFWDRLDQNGAPASNYLVAIDQTQFPISTAPQQPDTVYPMRWVHREFYEIYTKFADSTGFTRKPTSSLKIRRRIGDREGLYLALAVRTDTGAAGDGTYRLSASGTLYYRWIF